MRTSERLRGLKKWTNGKLCAGRQMKTYGEEGNIFEIEYVEPQCCLGWWPTRPDVTGRLPPDTPNVCPGILIMPNPGKAKAIKLQAVDVYKGVNRPKELGQTLNVTFLFSVYEPGIRLPGFAEGRPAPEFVNGMPAVNYSRFQEGTEEGLCTLMDWMDDLMAALLAQQKIPETDLFVNEASIEYSLYTDQGFVVDKRPVFYGFVTVEFGCYAEEDQNPILEQYLT